MSKLIIAVVHRDDSRRVVNAFQAAGLRVTELGSQGGFLRARNTTLMLGLADEQVDQAMGILEANCKTRTEDVPVDVMSGMDVAWQSAQVTHGGATIFIMPLESIRRI